MASFLTALTAVERLSAHGSQLPPEFARALGEDLEYGRFGAALIDLPRFGGVIFGLQDWVGQGSAPRFTHLYRNRAPVAFGLKTAELVANGALVGTEAGLAFLAGYFTQLCVARAVEPVVVSLINQLARPGDDEKTRERIEWTQSLYLMQELHGSTLVGTSAIRTKLHIRKGGGPRGVGRGFYELIRVASHESLGEAPSKGQVDAWVRGLYLYAVALGSPAGRLRGLKSNAPMSQKELYRGPGVDVWAAFERGLAHTHRVLTVLGGLIRRGSFTARSRSKVLDLLPEGSPSIPLPELPQSTAQVG
jgi:hypothetical protein